MNQQFRLTYQGTETTLSVNPEGWSDNGQQWQRDKVYHGVFQSFTVETFRFPYKFNGGGDIILEAYNNDGIKAEVLISVYNRNSQTHDFDLSYSGKLNFDPDRINIERDFIEVGFVASDNIQRFVTRDEIEFNINDNISFDGVTMNEFVSAPAPITFTPVDILRKVEAQGNYERRMYWTEPDDDAPLLGEKVPANSTQEIYFYADNVDINEIQDSFTATSGPDHSDRSQYLYKNNTGGDVEISISNFEQISSEMTFGHQDLRPPGGFTAGFDLGYNWVLRIHDSDENVIPPIFQSDITEVSLTSTPGEIFNGSFEAQYTGDFVDTYSVPEGGYLSLRMRIVVSNQVYTRVRVFDPINMSVKFQENALGATTSNINCYYPHEAFTRLFQLITSQENTFYSELLGRTDSEFLTYSSKGTASETAIVSGWNLREFPDKQFTLTLKKLFQTFDSVYNVGMSYDQTNQRFYIEEKAKFYDETVYMFDLGDIEDLKITPLKNTYINSIKTGFEADGKYENFQGVNEFNLKQEYSIESPVKNTLSKVAPYRADTIGMELTRRKNYVEFSQEDTDQDEEIFIIKTFNGSVSLDSTLRGFDGITQYYNSDITPRKNVLRWAKWLNVNFWKEGTWIIRFRKSTKDVGISYRKPTELRVFEFSDIDQDDVTEVRLFNPEVYEFEGPFNESFKTQLNTNPHGVITFRFNGVTYEAFVDEILTKDYEKKATYKLIGREASASEKIFMDGDTALFMDDDTHLFV